MPFARCCVTSTPHVLDLPGNYVKHPDAFQVVKDVPTDWGESMGLAPARSVIS